MLELYFATSPNVLKVVIALEELSLIYRLIPVDLSKGEQHDPALLGGAITGKVPVLRDDAPTDGGSPLVLAESGAIMHYLGEKFGHYIGASGRGRVEVMQWLFWQMCELGPISGQTWHFEIRRVRVKAKLDKRSYREGVHAPQPRSKLVSLTRDKFQGD